jgi:hypothetical protein
LSVCKDELGVDLTTVNSFVPTSSDNGNNTSTEAGITEIGPAAAAAAVNPDSNNSGAIGADSLPLGFLVAAVGSVVLCNY